MKLPFNLKRVKRFLFGSIALLALTGGIVTENSAPEIAHSADATAAPVPRFNFQPGDVEMLKAADVTRKDTGWADPLSADVGHRLIFQLYFHNGVVNSTAHNTSVRVDFPKGETNKLDIVSWLWSSETPDPIRDTVINGQIFGKSGGTVDLNAPGRTEYVNGSTKLWNSKGEFVRQLPDGIYDAGINIGEVQGCFQYAGFVTFMIDVKGHADLKISKLVRHLNGDWQSTITAVPDEEIEYQVSLDNTGSANAAAVVLKDELSPYLTYVQGSTIIRNTANPNGIPAGNQLFQAGGLSVPEMAFGPAGKTFVTYRVKAIDNFPGGWWTLNNLATVFMAGAEQGHAQAAVRVFGARPGLTLTKNVFDGVNYVKQITANLGETVTYKIIVANTGNTVLSNVFVRDVIPVFTEYIPGSTRINNFPAQDLIITDSGIRFASLTPNESQIIDFQVKIIGCPPLDYKLTNTASVKSDGTAEINDSAFVIVKVPLPQDPSTR